jgi:formylglycine-generating enzyme required for sulfatase activity
MRPIDDNHQDTDLSSFTIDDLDMEFVRIPAGEFEMGSPAEEMGHRDDENRHRVRISQDYYLQTTEVTQKQWRTVVMSTENASLIPEPSYFIACGEDCPVERVSWDNAQLFIDYLNRRYEGTYEFYLPTEAQWEYAARAGSDTAFADGDITITGCGLDPVLDPIGWYCFNARNSTMPVSTKNSNAFGLFDMNGNVAEWCQDYYEEEYSYVTEPVIDPQGPTTGTFRVIRGGHHYSRAEYCRSAYRWRDFPHNNSESLYGFRLACDPIGN